MIVIAWMYNTNGMASWCWEAAYALHEAGEAVLLVCHPNVQLSEPTPFDVIRFETPQKSHGRAVQKFKAEFSRLSPQSSGFVYDLHSHLQERGIHPSVYLLNQSDLQDPRVPVPQYVTGRAYPTSFRGYCAKIGIYSGGKFNRNGIRSALSTIGWWGKDRRAYRSASGVLSVSKRLDVALKQQGVRSHLVHPGSKLRDTPQTRAAKTPYRLLTVALDLEDPRKK